MGGLIALPVERSCMPHPEETAMASPKIPNNSPRFC